MAGVLQEKVKALQNESTKAKRKNEASVAKANMLAADLAKSRDKIATLETQNRELIDNIQGTTADHATVIAELSVTNTQRATELQSKAKQITTLEEDIGILQTNKQALTAQISSAQERITELHNENISFRENVRTQGTFGNARARNIEDGDVNLAGGRPGGQREVEFSGQNMSGETGSKAKYLTMSIEDRESPSHVL
jgi:chromosome segregation ATPase